MIRDVLMVLAGICLATMTTNNYGAPEPRESCESYKARWALCRAQLERSGATVGDLKRQLKEYCR